MYSSMRVSPGVFTSTMSRDGLRGSASGQKRALLHSMKSCGTRMLLMRLENPTMRPRMCSTLSSPENVNCNGTIPTIASLIWGKPCDGAKPKL